MGEYMRIRNTTRVMAAVLASGLFVGACGSDDDNSLSVELTEFSVTVSGSASSGEVTVNASNVGGEDHELVVVKGISVEDLAQYQDETGFVVEDDLPEGAFIDEISEFEAGSDASGVFNLEPGEYVFFCNITEEQDDGTWESHYTEGMHAAVTIGS